MTKLFKGMGLVLAGAMTVSMFAGCSAASKEAPKTEKTSTTQEADTATDKPAEKVKLTLRAPYNEQGSQRGTIYKEVLDQFLAENPNIEVEFENIDAESNKTKVNVEIAGGITPDIFQASTWSTAEQYVKAGKLADITSYFEKDTEWKNSFVNGALKQIDGKNYTVPVEGFSELMYYNKDIFTKVGLEEPKTWDEFVNCVKVLKDNGYIPIALGDKQIWCGGFMFQMIMDNVAGTDTLYKALSGEMKFNNPDYVKAAQMWIDLVDMGAFNEGAAVAEEAEADAMFYQEKAGMFCTGNWSINRWTGADANEGFADRVGAFVLPLPEGGKGKPSYFGGYNASFVISSELTGAKLDAAVALLKYVQGPVYMERAMSELGQLSTVILPNMDSLSIPKPLVEAQNAIKDVPTSVNVYDGIMPQAVAGAWLDSIQKWLAGDKDIAAGLDAIDDANQKQLKASN